MFLEREKLRADLKVFLTVIASLIIIGLLFIYSSSSVYALEKFGSAHYFVKKQLVGLVLGIIALVITRFIPLEWIKKASPFLFFGALALTALTLFGPLAVRIHGSSRWLNLKGFMFQPSEFFKMALLIYAAFFLTKKERKTN